MKNKIIKQLKRTRQKLNNIIDLFESLEEDNDKENNIKVFNITFHVFDMVDMISKVEIDIYKYFKRRG